MISRFYFNISIQENLKNIFNILFFKKNNFEPSLKKEMSKIYNNSNFYFFDYGRTAFFEILSNKAFKYLVCESSKKKLEAFKYSLIIILEEVFGLYKISKTAHLINLK